MVKYILKRVVLAFVTLFIIMSLTFILIKLLKPSQPIGLESTRIAYYNNEVRLGFAVKYTNEKHEELKDLAAFAIGDDIVYYYQVPIMKQYGAWLKNIFTAWDWGQSTAVTPGADAMAIIGKRLPTTIKINIFAVIFSVPTGIALGIWAALKKNTMTDHIISTLVMVFISVPSFILITFVMLLFCFTWHILPSAWALPTDPTSKKVLSYIIPVFCLSFGSICGYCRYTRAELCEVMSSDYLLLARTKGLTKRQAILRHALRNAMVPIVPSILAEFIGILGGSMILENLYSIPGIGSLYIDALGADPKDLNVLFVDMAFFTIISLLAGVVLDLSYGFIDPRIRMGAKK